MVLAGGYATDLACGWDARSGRCARPLGGTGRRSTATMTSGTATIITMPTPITSASELSTGATEFPDRAFRSRDPLSLGSGVGRRRRYRIKRFAPDAGG